MSQTFDPAAHLAKQGWKGKGTALRNGHATRPLAVVQKKTLSGIGKDRDEAVPFWDHIFASTAASILSSATPSASGSPAPTPPPKPVPSAAARCGREVARRGLYSRFFKGTSLSVDPTPPSSPPPHVEEGTRIVEEVAMIESESEEDEAGPSTSVEVVEVGKKKKGKGKSVVEGEETKEERRARRAERSKVKAEREERRAKRAEKALVKAEKEARRTARAAKRAEKEGKRKKSEKAVVDGETGREEKVKKRKKTSGPEGVEDGVGVSQGTAESASRGKKRKIEA